MEPYIFLSQIRPEDIDWTAKVLVEDKLNLYVNNRGTKILKLLVTDEKRDKVEVLIWNNDIPALDVRLEPFNTYYIRGPLVRNINPDFSRIAPGITTQWTMRAHNYVKRIEDASLQITYPPITSALFTDVQYFAGKGIPLDMVAIVVEVREPRSQESHMIQEFVMINQEQISLKPVQLTMWNDFLKSHGVTLAAMKNQMPIIMCKRLQAGNFRGMPVLSTTPSSFIVIQPAIPEVANLQTWKNKNLDTIRLAHKDYYNHAPTRMPRYMPDKFVSIVQLHFGSSAVWIKGHITIPNVCQPLAYLSCSSCGSKTSALLRHEFTCNICGKHGLPSPRCWLLVDFVDETGSINVAVFDKYAEKILGTRAAGIAASKREEIKILCTTAADRFAEKEVVAEIRASRKMFSDGIVRFNIPRWFEVDGATTRPLNTSTSLKTYAIDITDAKSLTTSASSSKTALSGSRANDAKPIRTSTSEEVARSNRIGLTTIKKLELESDEPNSSTT